MKRKMEVVDGTLFVQFGTRQNSAFHAPVGKEMQHFLGWEQTEKVFWGKVPKSYRKAWARLRAGRVISQPM